ncbi:MAG: AbrB/MazE/SpoVT family DNA-binding domain-containing protein [Nitrososphaerales archaeon]
MQSSERRVISKVTRKGQITIPASFRSKHGIVEGSAVEIDLEDSRLTVKPIPDLLKLVGVDKGKYDPTEIKEMLDKSRKNWR